MVILFQFAIGLIFGLGLLISGMSDPAKVLNFLDLAAIRSGTWDPSLAFVMAGAIAAPALRAASPRQYEIVGPVCESTDVVGRDRTLPELAVGDLLAIRDTGVRESRGPLTLW